MNIMYIKLIILSLSLFLISKQGFSQTFSTETILISTSLDIVRNYGSGDSWCKWKSAVRSYISGGTYGSKGNQSSGKIILNL